MARVVCWCWATTDSLRASRLYMSCSRHGATFLVILCVFPQSCAIALRSPASERAPTFHEFHPNFTQAPCWRLAPPTHAAATSASPLRPPPAPPPAPPTHSSPPSSPAGRKMVVARHLPAALACLIAALLVRWSIRRWPQPSTAGSSAAAALDGRLASQDWPGAYSAWCDVLKERPDVAHSVAQAHVDRMGAAFRMAAPPSSSAPRSPTASEVAVAVSALHGAAIFAGVHEAETLLHHALQERTFTETAEKVTSRHPAVRG